MTMSDIDSEASLIGLALALGAHQVAGWHAKELAIAEAAPRVKRSVVVSARKQIEAGNDPLGEIFCTLRTPVERREEGATYTPNAIVAAMTGWARRNAEPSRIVDPGAGSGRFLV